MDGLSALSESLARVIEKIGAGVVGVEGRGSRGTGVAWSSDGLVVTADHVVRHENGVRVRLADGATVDADLVGRDPTTDVALLRARGAALTVPLWADPAWVPGHRHAVCQACPRAHSAGQAARRPAGRRGSAREPGGTGRAADGRYAARGGRPGRAVPGGAVWAVGRGADRFKRSYSDHPRRQDSGVDDHRRGASPQERVRIGTPASRAWPRPMRPGP